MCTLLLYLPLSNKIKNQIIKSYCFLNNKYNNLQITNYYDTLLYFQNKYSYKCYKCNKIINGDYYLVICNCFSNLFYDNYIIYPKYHLKCIPNKNKNTKNKQLYIINCEICNKTRLCFLCNIYS